MTCLMAGANERHETRVSANRLRPLSVLMTGRRSVDWLTMALVTSVDVCCRFRTVNVSGNVDVVGFTAVNSLIGFANSSIMWTAVKKFIPG